MVMPLTGEDRPKCYMCGSDFAGISEMREHQKTEHGEDSVAGREPGPAPGDVTVF